MICLSYGHSGYGQSWKSGNLSALPRVCGVLLCMWGAFVYPCGVLLCIHVGCFCVSMWGAFVYLCGVLLCTKILDLRGFDSGRILIHTVFVCTCIHMCIYIYIYIYTCLHVCMCIYIYIYYTLYT